MNLPDKRVGPYVRALHSGLNALAPHEDFVPLGESLAHLRALDPELSGNLLFPAEVERSTGMPSYPWLERVQSEQALAHQGSDADDADETELARAERLDAELGARMRHRRDLRRHLRRWNVLPSTRMVAAARRLEPDTEYTTAYDRLAPDGRWLRIRVDMLGPANARVLGPLRLVNSAGRVSVDEGFQHLLTRHFYTPLMALREHLEHATGATVRRLSRSWVGPFWFPGVNLPGEVPPMLGQGLLLHVSTEVVADDVRHAVHLDPLAPPDPNEVVPKGHQVFRERRFAASANLVDAVERWSQNQGVRTVVVPLGGSRKRSL